MDEDVVEDIVIGDASLRVVRLVRILKKDARLKARAFVFAYPCKFEALLAVAQMAAPSCFVVE